MHVHRKHVAFSALMVLSFSVSAVAQSLNQGLLKMLVKNEQALADAIAVGDKAIWNKYLHDSCLITIEDGSTLDKKKFLDELNPLPKGYVGRINVIEPQLQVHGKTAVLTFIDDEYLELYNQKIHTQYRQTNTWINFNGQWKIIAMQLFEIPKNPPAIVVNSEILNQYAGTYVLSTDREAFVYVEGGKLFVKKGERPAQELFAQTDNVFFRKGDGRVDIIFLKDSGGQLRMIERREGEDLVWKKK